MRRLRRNWLNLSIVALRALHVGYILAVLMVNVAWTLSISMILRRTHINRIFSETLTWRVSGDILNGARFTSVGK
jgi:hypothetical protein